MASSVIGALRVNLGLDSAKFESGARRVQQPLQAMRKQFVAVSAVAVAMGAALSAAALKGAQEIDKSAKAARRLGTSIGSFRALELAAGEAGVSLSTLTDGVQTMDREIAKGSKGAARALDTLGLSAKDLGGLEADEKVALIADRIKALGLTTGQASVVLQDLGSETAKWCWRSWRAEMRFATRAKTSKTMAWRSARPMRPRSSRQMIGSGGWG